MGSIGKVVGKFMGKERWMMDVGSEGFIASILRFWSVLGEREKMAAEKTPEVQQHVAEENHCRGGKTIRPPPQFSPV